MNVRSKRMQGLFIVEVFVRGSYTQSGISFFTRRGDVSARVADIFATLPERVRLLFSYWGWRLPSKQVTLNTRANNRG